MSGKQFYNVIESYLSGSMDAEARVEFENQIKQDHDLQENVKLHQTAELLIRKKGLLDVKELVAREDAHQRKIITYKKAAIGILIITIGFIGMMVYWNTKNEKLHIPLKATSKLVPMKSEVQQLFKNLDVSANLNNLPQKAPISNEVLPSGAQQYINLRVGTDTSAAILDQNRKVASRDSTLEKNNLMVSSLKKAETITNPCSDIDISAHVTVTPSCAGEHTGSISVSGFTGGQRPYKANCYRDGRNPVLMQHLAPGKYAIEVQDANGCLKHLEEVLVGDMNCKKEFYLNPFVGDNWEIPAHEGPGTLTVYDEMGNIYYKADVAAGVTNTWNGVSINGEIKTGYFLFNIRYWDGTYLDGTITLGK